MQKMEALGTGIGRNHSFLSRLYLIDVKYELGHDNQQRLWEARLYAHLCLLLDDVGQRAGARVATSVQQVQQRVARLQDAGYNSPLVSHAASLLGSRHHGIAFLTELQQLLKV